MNLHAYLVKSCTQCNVLASFTFWDQFCEFKSKTGKLVRKYFNVTNKTPIQKKITQYIVLPSL